MAYDVYTLSGVVLDVWNHKEWDKRFIFFSKEYGIITVTAIGAQKPKSKLRGFINRFCFIEIDIVHGKTGYRLIRARSNMGGFLIHKKESYFLLSKVSKLFINLLPTATAHEESFMLFVNLGQFLEKNIITMPSVNILFYETALELLSILGYRKNTMGNFSYKKINTFDPALNESVLIEEYQMILNENGIVNMV